MYGKAILNIPASGSIGPSRTEGLSDDMAVSFGRIAALTLLDTDGRVKVTLSTGSVLYLGEPRYET